MTDVPIGAAWRAIRDRFRAAGLDTPELDARLLAQAAFELDALGLSLQERDVAPSEQVARLDALAARRLAGEPVARILGEKEFYGLAFALDASTLVPRPETELLVDLALKQLGAGGYLLDLGTGSGAIPVAILATVPDATAVAIDLDPGAVAMTQGNAVRAGVAARLDVRTGSWFAPLRPDERFDLIVSNPPYIETAAIAGLDREVRDHDPLLALDGGADGLDAYRIIAVEAGRWLRPEGAVMVEIGATQGEAVAGLFIAAGFRNVSMEKDLAGLDRVVLAYHH